MATGAAPALQQHRYILQLCVHTSLCEELPWLPGCVISHVTCHVLPCQHTCYNYTILQARSGGSRKGIGRRKISYSTRPSSSTKRSSRSKRLSEHEREDTKRPFHVSNYGEYLVALVIACYIIAVRCWVLQINWSLKTPKLCIPLKSFKSLSTKYYSNISILSL